jgi:hypothetical protein
MNQAHTIALTVTTATRHSAQLIEVSIGEP